MGSASGKGGRVSRRKEMDEKCSCCAEEVGKPRKVRPPHLWGTRCEEQGESNTAASPVEMQTAPPMPIPWSLFACALCKPAKGSCQRTENSSILNKAHF